MKSLRAIVLMTGSFLAADQPKEKVPGNDKGKLQGDWVLASATLDGRDMTAELARQGFKILIKGDKIMWGPPDSLLDSPLVIDWARQSKSFDIFISFGIHELKGNELKVCFGGSERPTEFAAKAGSGNLLFVFKRGKAKP